MDLLTNDRVYRDRAGQRQCDEDVLHDWYVHGDEDNVADESKAFH